MAEASISPESQRLSPTKETFKHLRHKITEKFPAAKKLFDKSGTEPTKRELINTAGVLLRAEIESDYDPDTNLLNKGGFQKEKLDIKKISGGIDNNIVVGVIDLDNLKEVNDTQGHDAGDALIKSTANAIVRVSRDTDIVARVGGDEFNIILTETSPDEAEGWRKRIAEEFETKGVEASIGINPVSGLDIDGSLKTADQLMYVEKRRHKKSRDGFNGLFKKIKAVLTRGN